MNKTILSITFLLFTIGLSAQELTMFNGFITQEIYQDTDRISRKEASALMSKVPQSNEFWEKANRHEIISYVSAGITVGFLIYFTSGNINESNFQLPLTGILAGSLGTSIFSLSHYKNRKKAILNYNDQLDNPKLGFGPTYNGMGLVYSF